MVKLKVIGLFLCFALLTAFFVNKPIRSQIYDAYINLTSQVFGILPVANGGTGQIQPLNNVPQRPIVASVGHSYISNFSAVSTVVSASKASNVASLTLAGGNITLSTGAAIQVVGCGAPYDQQIITLSAANNVTSTYSYAISDGTSGSITPTYGSCRFYSLGQNSVFGGFNSQNYLAWANAYLGDVFDQPRSYMFPASGGGFISLFATDPGFVVQSQLVAAKSPLPQVVTVDYGINDCSNGKTVSQIMTAVTSGMAILNAVTHNVIFMLPRPSNDGSSVNQCMAQLNTALKMGAAQGKWYIDDTRKRLADPTSSTGVMLANMTVDGIHLSTTGAMQDGLDFANKFGWMFPSTYSPVASQTDEYNASNNPQGDVVGSMPLRNTVSVITLSGTPQAIGPFWVYVSGAGTETVTAIISARVDTFVEGTTVPGYELVLTSTGGSGAKIISVVYGATSSYSVLGPANSGTVYSGGQQLYAVAEMATDLSTLTGATNVQPYCTLKEGGLTSPLTPYYAAMNDTTPGNSSTQFEYPKLFLTTPVMTAQSNAASFYLQFGCSIAFAGTPTANPTFRIRNMAIYPNTGIYQKVAP